MPCDPASPATTLILADAAATAQLGQRLAALARRRDVIALHGDLGMGKTSLARAFVQAASGSQEDVPSPTFTLVQIYETPVATIWHVDAYRLKQPDEVWELGLEEALADGILLIEWPERFGAHLPVRRLDLYLSQHGAGRLARLVAADASGWAERLAHLGYAA